MGCPLYPRLWWAVQQSGLWDHGCIPLATTTFCMFPAGKHPLHSGCCQTAYPIGTDVSSANVSIFYNPAVRPAEFPAGIPVGNHVLPAMDSWPSDSPGPSGPRAHNRTASRGFPEGSAWQPGISRSVGYPLLQPSSLVIRSIAAPPVRLPWTPGYAEYPCRS